MLFCPQSQIDAIPPARAFRAKNRAAPESFYAQALRAPRKNAALYDEQASGATVATYLHTDHLGTPRFGTNAAGSQVWAWTNDAFGISSPTGTATVNLRMPGQYYDSESGLFYNINRTYNPAIGRFMSSDPIGLAGGSNTFNYSGADPVNVFDSAGLKFRNVSALGPDADSDPVIADAYNMLCGTKAGDWFNNILSANKLTLEDMFFGNKVTFNYGYYEHTSNPFVPQYLGDETAFGSSFGEGHTSWGTVLPMSAGFENQPGYTAGLTSRALDALTPDQRANLFVHEAAQLLIGMRGLTALHGPNGEEWAQYISATAINEPGTSKCQCTGK